MRLFTLLSWKFNGSHNKHYFPPPQFCFLINPRGPGSCFACYVYQQQHISVLFFGLYCSIGSASAWLVCAFKMMKGSAECWGRQSLICMMCLLLLFLFVISFQQPDRWMWGNLKKTDVFLSAATCVSDWHMFSCMLCMDISSMPED